MPRRRQARGKGLLADLKAPRNSGLAASRHRTLRLHSPRHQAGRSSGARGRKVYEAVHAAHGIVLHSSVESGSKGATGAIFELLIPTGKVDDALGLDLADRRSAARATTRPPTSPNRPSMPPKNWPTRTPRSKGC